MRLLIILSILLVGCGQSLEEKQFDVNELVRKEAKAMKIGAIRRDVFKECMELAAQLDQSFESKAAYKLTMSWNYRVFQKENADKSFFYEIHEVYYTEEGNIRYTSENPMSAFGESIKELGRDLEMLKAALEKPVIVEKDITYYT